MADDIPVQDLRAGDVVELLTAEGPRLVRVSALLPRVKSDKLVYRIDGCDQHGEPCSGWALTSQLVRRIEFVDVGDGMPYADPDFKTFEGPWCQTCLLPRHDWRRLIAAGSPPPGGLVEDLEPCQYCGDTQAFWESQPGGPP